MLTGGETGTLWEVAEAAVLLLNLPPCSTGGTADTKAALLGPFLLWLALRAEEHDHPCVCVCVCVCVGGGYTYTEQSFQTKQLDQSNVYFGAICASTQPA